jgi:hypothetical protein
MVARVLFSISHSSKVVIDGQKKTPVWVDSAWISDGRILPRYRGLVCAKLQMAEFYSQPKNKRINYLYPGMY